MAAVPSYTRFVISAVASIATANTNRDGTGTLGTVYTALAHVAGQGSGARIDSITVKATGTTTAGVIRIYVDDGTARLVREILVSAITPSATVKSWEIPTSEGADANGILQLGILLKPGDILKASTHNAETFIVRAQGGEF